MQYCGFAAWDDNVVCRSCSNSHVCIVAHGVHSSHALQTAINAMAHAGSVFKHVPDMAIRP